MREETQGKKTYNTVEEALLSGYRRARVEAEGNWEDVKNLRETLRKREETLERRERDLDELTAELDSRGLLEEAEERWEASKRNRPSENGNPEIDREEFLKK